MHLFGFIIRMVTQLFVSRNRINKSALLLKNRNAAKHNCNLTRNNALFTTRYMLRHTTLQNFDVLLSVHLSMFISVFNQLDAQNKFYFMPLHVSSTCTHHL